jgi:lipopolysaccharide biosynthesis regulator YciM
VRALILAGDLEMKRGRPEEALRQWQKVEAASPEHVALIAGRMADTMDAAGDRKGALNWLRRALLDMPSIDLLDVAQKRVNEWEGHRAAEALVSEELRRHPSLLGFERLLETRLAMNKDDAEMQLLASLLRGQTRKLARFRCTRCGFRAREYHWNCPGCTGWDTYPPRRIEELDVA